MNIAEDVESRPGLAMPPRPAHPLSTLQMMRVGFTNSLAVCDEELFVERRFIWGRLFVISDPDGIKRVLQDNVDNYPRIDPIRRVFAFGSGTGMLYAEGEVWRRQLWTDPDRFAPGRVAARSRYSYLPFSLGPRVYTGAQLAIAGILVTVAVLARRFRFQLIPGQRVEPIARTNLRPRRIRMTIESRHPPLARAG